MSNHNGRKSRERVLRDRDLARELLAFRAAWELKDIEKDFSKAWAKYREGVKRGEGNEEPSGNRPDKVGSMG